MTFLEICQNIRQECGIQGSGPASVTSQSGILQRVITWACAADMEIQMMNPDWDFLWSEFSTPTTAGSENITKPNDFGMWDRESFAINAGESDGYRLSYVPYSEWRSYVGEKQEVMPAFITILPNNNLAFSVKADATYTFNATYWKAPIKLTANDQEPVYPARYQRAIIDRAKMYFYEDIESFDQMATSKQSFDNWVAELENFSLPSRQLQAQHSPAAIVVRAL